jgi:hypothetical protein
MSTLKAAWLKIGHLVIIVAAILAVYLVGTGTWGGNISARWYWMIGIMLVFVMLIGLTVNKRLDGALIDWRNKMSLSHLQVILWTILGMSAFLTIGLTRISVIKNILYDPETAFEQAYAVGDVECLQGLSEEAITQEILDTCPVPDPLQIIFPEELLLAMGISLASFAGSTLVKSNQSNTTILSANEERNLREQIIKTTQEKKDAMKEVDKINTLIEAERFKKIEAEHQGRTNEVESADQNITYYESKQKEYQQKAETADTRIGDKQKELDKYLKEMEDAKGLLATNKTPQEAQWSDIFKKEKSGEQELVDLSKVQMFFFTIAVIFAYATALNSLMQQTSLVENPFGVVLPAFSASLVILLGVSHGGYLVTKNTDLPSTSGRKE